MLTRSIAVFVVIISAGLFGYVGSPAAQDPPDHPDPPSRSISVANCALAAEHSIAHQGHTLLIMQHGHVIYESYDNEWEPDEPHGIASGTKSFFGPLAAAAVDDGLLSFDELASDTITEWKVDPRKRRITIRQLLTFISGLDPLFDPFETEDELASGDLYSLIVNVDMVGEPGQTWQYGNTHLIAFGEVLRRKLKASGRDISMLQYLNQRLLDPLEIEVAEWMLDGQGNPVPSTGVKITAREWAKWGEFIRTGGKAPSGEQLVNAKTLAECFKGTKPHGGYGMGW